jgi:uncharacterized protein YdaU (DUF1376 family)
MKPNSYMPFYGSAFFQAVEGQPDFIASGYLRAIWYYWSHAHCEGIPDNEEFLRRLCRIEKEYWPYAREVIFDNDQFFTMGEDGKWHQKRAAEEWKKSSKKYEQRVNQTAAALAARKGKRR